MMFRDIWIYDITSIENVTLNWLGTNIFSQLNATQCYYNTTLGLLEVYENSRELGLFGYHNTDTIQHKLRAGENGVPFILPINGTKGLEVDVMADIINSSCYSPEGNPGINLFDSYSSDTLLNRIYFSNSSDGYFSDIYYYENGTLDHASVELRI
ncbi:MAG: hypothetical protein JXA99_01840 [Candidatus Lokiarchaeota archaeon]|nr:hypothetical protein [Candidatus Lokiarchaeota archaeon]